MNKLRYILQRRYLYKILLIIIIAYVAIRTGIYKKSSSYTNETEFTGIVYKIKRNDDKTTIYIKTKEKLIINYYDELKVTLALGDKIKVNGKLIKPTNNTIPNLFNYKKYLYNSDIFYMVTANKITKIANNTNILYYIKNKLSKRIDSIPHSKEYIKIFIIGDNSDLSSDVRNNYRINGISHLFSISGMHISLFAFLLLYFLKRISYNNFYNYGVIISFLIIYALLIGESPSLIRSITMYILFAVNKLLNLKIKRLDIMYIVLIIILLIKPYYIYNTSFQFSYLISFFLILNYKNINAIKNKIMKTLYISIIIFLVSFPICIYNSYEINILSIVLNILFIPLVSLIIFPLSLICFLIPKVSILLPPIINVIEKTSNTIYKYNMGIITFAKPKIYFIAIYYLLIILFLYYKKQVIIIIIFLIIALKVSIIFDNSYQVTMLDVGEGDSIFIKLKHNHGNILIDTGGNQTNEYSIIDNSTIPYLKSRGIGSLNYLILTHGDFDHMGEAINLVNNFKVEKVIFNCGPYNDLEKELIKVLDKKKIPYYSCIKELNIDKNKLYFLQTREYDNENDFSNVIYTELDGYKFMFMGDASITTEQEILKKYNLPGIDVLKVGHHGSKTSSSIDFINKINPGYSIISVGKNNRYGHPNKEVLNNLKDSKIYRTDQDGSIMFKIKNNKLKIETCSS